MLCLYVLVMSRADLCLPLLVAWLQWPLRRRTQTQTVVVHIWMIQYHSVSIVPVPWMATGIHYRDWTCKILQFSEIHNQEENARPVSVSGQAKHVQNFAVQHDAHMFTHLLRWHLRVVLPTSSSAIAKLWTRCEARVQTYFRVQKLVLCFHRMLRCSVLQITLQRWSRQWQICIKQKLVMATLSRTTEIAFEFENDRFACLRFSGVRCGLPQMAQHRLVSEFLSYPQLCTTIWHKVRCVLQRA